MTLEPDNTYKYEFPDDWYIRESQHLKLTNNKFQNTTDPPGNSYILPALMLEREIDGKERSLTTNLFNLTFKIFLENIEYLGPLRDHPKRNYIWTGSATKTIGPHGENTIAALLTSERHQESLVNDVTTWLKRMGLVDEFLIDVIDRDKRFYEIVKRPLLVIDTLNTWYVLNEDEWR